MNRGRELCHRPRVTPIASLISSSVLKCCGTAFARARKCMALCMFLVEPMR